MRRLKSTRAGRWAIGNAGKTVYRVSALQQQRVAGAAVKSYRSAAGGTGGVAYQTDKQAPRAARI